MTSGVFLNCSASLQLFPLACFKLLYSLYNAGIKTHSIKRFCLGLLDRGDIKKCACSWITHIKKCAYSWSPLELDQCPPGKLIINNMGKRATNWCGLSHFWSLRDVGSHLDLTYLGWFLLVLFNKLLLPGFQPKFYFIISIHGKFYWNDTPYFTDFNSPFQSDLPIMKNMSGESYIIANKVLLECLIVS